MDQLDFFTKEIDVRRSKMQYLLLFSFFPDLTHLPDLPEHSPLKYLDARQCSIQSINASWIRYGLQLDLKDNEISILPRNAMLRYLSCKEGRLDCCNEENGVPGLAFDRNPLQYPPKCVYMRGKKAVISYLNNWLEPTGSVTPTASAINDLQNMSGSTPSLPVAENLTERITDIHPPSTPSQPVTPPASAINDLQNMSGSTPSLPVAENLTERITNIHPPSTPSQPVTPPASAIDDLQNMSGSTPSQNPIRIRNFGFYDTFRMYSAACVLPVSNTTQMVNTSEMVTAQTATPQARSLSASPSRPTTTGPSRINSVFKTIGNFFKSKNKSASANQGESPRVEEGMDFYDSQQNTISNEQAQQQSYSNNLETRQSATGAIAGIEDTTLIEDLITMATSNASTVTRNASTPSRGLVEPTDENPLECGVCLDNRKNCVFNCGHLSCFECAELLERCHICRITITTRIRMFLDA